MGLAWAGPGIPPLPQSSLDLPKLQLQQQQPWHAPIPARGAWICQNCNCNCDSNNRGTPYPWQRSLDLSKLQLQQQQPWHTLSLAEQPGSAKTATATATALAHPIPARAALICPNCNCNSNNPGTLYPWQSSLDLPKRQLRKQEPWQTLSLAEEPGSLQTATATATTLAHPIPGRAAWSCQNCSCNSNNPGTFYPWQRSLDLSKLQLQLQQ